MNPVETLLSAGSSPVLRCFPQGAILVFDHDLRYLSVGGTDLTPLGLSQQRLEGNTIFEVFDTGTVATIEPRYRAALAGQESTYDAPRGDTVYLVRLLPLTENGRIIAGMAVVQDVTVARHSERALRQSEEEFRVAFDHAPIGKALVGLDGRYERVNEALCHLTGYSEAQLRNLTAHDLTHPADRADVARAMGRLIDGEMTTYSAEKRYLTASGGAVWTTTSASLVRRDDGSPLHFISQVEDITERKQHEKVLSDERRRLHAAQSVGHVGSWEMDATTNAITWSDTLLELYGLDPAEFAGDYTAALSRIHPDDHSMVQDALDSCIRTGQPFSVRHRLLRADDGSTRWVVASGAPITEDGERVSIAGAVVDVTPQVMAAEDMAHARDLALEASRLKSAFLATMSHEIRTPMNAVIGMTALLLDTPLEGEQRELLEIVRTSGDALLGIINDILDFSKIEAGGLRLEETSFDLRGCVEDALDLMAVTSRAKGLELIGDVSDSCPARVVGDVTRLRQVLVNLLGNAVKFTPGGEVLLTVDTEGGLSDPEEVRLSISVTDTGIGIPPERLATLFDSFVQGDASTTRLYGGTGLGLAISQRLVEAMGGELSVESACGEGSTFRFTVPLRRATDLPAAPEPGPSAGRSALIVDDHRTNRRILRRQLEGWGWRVTAMASGDAAMALVESGATFDVALLDHDMPGMSGEELAARLRAAPTTAPTPLLLLSSHTDRGQVDRRDLFSAILTKPIRSARLQESLGAAMRTGGRADAVTLPPAPTEEQNLSWRVLLAEDNLANQRLGRLMLEKLGHQVDVVGNGRAAVEAVRDVAYDAVFMDIEMPEMDGLEASGVIRRDTAVDHQPRIVALTASALTETREVCLAAGMDDYLTKPLSLKALTDAIQRAAAAA